MGVYESGEDYLEAVLVLLRRNGYVRAVDVARHLKVSKPSVSKALHNLEREGLTEVVGRDVRLTTRGAQLAEEVLERHLFFHGLLVAAGVDPQTASEEACRMEHCLSVDSFRKLAGYWERSCSAHAHPVEEAAPSPEESVCLQKDGEAVLAGSSREEPLRLERTGGLRETS